jgi:hypothetical protein
MLSAGSGNVSEEDDAVGRKRVALIVTTYFFGSHGDVIGTRLIDGYEWGGEHIRSRVEVASMYLEQPDGPRGDVGLKIARRHGVPLFDTVGEAIALGRGGGVNVDGVVIIGEHGEYEDNAIGQKIYPRRRLFDTAVAAMIAGGRTVPIFTDKHLSHLFSDGRWMVDTATRLGIPMLAGSTIPLAWRVPQGSEWPAWAEMSEAVAVGFGDVEGYGFHTLEGLQVHAERRLNGETGVATVQGLTGGAALAAIADGRVNAELFGQALDRLGLDPASRQRATETAVNVFLVNYADGLRAAVVLCGEGVRNWAAAYRGSSHQMSCMMFLPGVTAGSPVEHFTFLVRHIENMVIEGREPWPVERTLLTTGILNAAMRSRAAGGERIDTPELAIIYRPELSVTDVGVPFTYPQPVRPA